MNWWMNHFQWWLIDFQAAATVLLAGTLFGARLSRQPARRVAVSWVTSAGLVFLCVAMAIPAWPRVHAEFRVVERSAAGRAEEAATGKGQRESLGISAGRVVPRIPEAPKAEPAAVAAADRAARQEAPASALRAARFDRAAVEISLSWLFLAGAAGMCFWLGLGMIEAVWLCRTAQPAPEELEEQLRAVSGTTERRPRLLLSSRVRNAVALGILRPTILLPATMAGRSEAKCLRAVLAHECAHIRNRDLWLLGLLRALLVVLFPNPLYWALRQMTRSNQEAVADAVAAEAREDYAEGLIGWMRLVSAPGWVMAASAVGIWEKPSELSKRIAMLIDEKFAVHTKVGARWRAAVMGLVSAVALGLSVLTVRPLSARETDQPPGAVESSVGTSAKTMELAQAQPAGGTVQPVVSPATDAQEKVYKDASALAEAGKLAEAEGKLDGLLAQLGGSSAPVLRLHSLELRGDVLARMGKFAEATKDFEDAVQGDPEDIHQWFRLAYVLAQTGDLGNYRARCKEMVHRFSNTTDPAVATQVAQACLVMASAVDAEDVASAEKLADAATALTPPGQFFPWRSMTIALAEYRRGELARANQIIDSITPAMNESGPGWSACRADVLLISAMTHQGLNHADKARTALEQGRQAVRTKLPTLDSQALPEDWWSIVFANMLMAEAGRSVKP